MPQEYHCILALLADMKHYVSFCVLFVLFVSHVHALNNSSTNAVNLIFGTPVWPRFGKSASIITYASAEQGSARGDYAIAWRYQHLPDDRSQYDSAVVNIQIRLLIPPGGKGILRFPVAPSSTSTAIIRSVQSVPDISSARSAAKKACGDRRKQKLGFDYNWEYDRKQKSWYKQNNRKAIGTTCESFLFHNKLIDSSEFVTENVITDNLQSMVDKSLPPGLYEVMINDWPLQKEVKANGRLGSLQTYYKSTDVGPYCSDSSEAEWNIEDSTHII